MAFDAAAVSAASPVRSAAKDQGAVRSDAGGEQSPFGALMSLLDQTVDEQASDNSVPVSAKLKGLAAPAETGAVEAETEKPAQNAEVAADAPPQPVDLTILAAVMIAPPPIIEPSMGGVPSVSPVLVANVTGAAPVPSTPEAGEAATPPASGTAVLLDAVVTAEVPAAPSTADAPVELTEGAEQSVATPPATLNAEPSPPPFAPAKGLRERLADLEPRQTTGDMRRADAGGRDVAANGVPGPAPQGGESEGHAYGDRPQDRSQGGQDGLARGQADAAPSTVLASLALTAEQSMAAAPIEAAPAPNATPPVPTAPAPAVASPPATPVAVPVRGSPETVAHLAAQMIQRLDGQSTRFDLALTPESMGRVQVRIEIDRQGALKARMSFENPTTAQDMGGRHAELRAALESAGFDLAEGALSFDVASGGENRGEAFGSHQDAPPRLFQSIAEAADPAPVPSAYFNGGARSAVDIRV